jgi:hypothetical protein
MKPLGDKERGWIFEMRFAKNPMWGLKGIKLGIRFSSVNTPFLNALHKWAIELM